MGVTLIFCLVTSVRKPIDFVTIDDNDDRRAEIHKKLKSNVKSNLD